MLCDRVLLRGYLQKTRAIDAAMVEAGARELGMTPILRGGGRRAAGGGAD
jgi:hypothetical protein